MLLLQSGSLQPKQKRPIASESMQADSDASTPGEDDTLLLQSGSLKLKKKRQIASASKQADSDASTPAAGAVAEVLSAPPLQLQLTEEGEGEEEGEGGYGAGYVPTGAEVLMQSGSLNPETKRQRGPDLRQALSDASTAVAGAVEEVLSLQLQLKEMKEDQGSGEGLYGLDYAPTGDEDNSVKPAKKRKIATDSV